MAGWGYSASSICDGDVIDRLVAGAATSPDQVLFVDLLDGVNESARLNAADLCARAAAVAGSLTRNGVKPGDVVLLIATPPSEFLIGLIGCMWAGVIAAPIAFPRRAEHLETRLEPVRHNAGAVAVIAGTPHDESEQVALELLTAGALPVIPVLSDAEGPPVAPVAERDIAYLQYTSGSTSDPRGVIVTHDNLIANLEVCRALLDYREDSVNVSWCPLTHDMGLIMGALPSVAFGMTSVLMTPSAFIRRPMNWLRAIDRYRGTHGYSPNFGYDLCVDRSTEAERAGLDLSCARAFVNGAEPVRRRTRDRFIDAFAVSGFPAVAHAAGYGLAESSVLVCATPPDSSGLVMWVDAAALEANKVVYRDEHDAGVRELCADGVPGPGYDVRIVDPFTLEELTPNQVGELWVRGPSVCPGYWRRAQATADAFGASIVGGDAGPYLRTGDLAFMHDGEIVICGRAKDLIVIHGRNLYPQDIEVTVESAHEAVRSGGSAAFAVDENGVEMVVVVAEVNDEPDQAQVVRAIQAAVLREFELRVLDVLLVPPQGIPKTSSGKKQRAATRHIWRDQRGSGTPTG
jgi:acyl-CoA synthetase (AMP-forming)/AMP-acid ligase II